MNKEIFIIKKSYIVTTEKLQLSSHVINKRASKPFCFINYVNRFFIFYLNKLCVHYLTYD